MDNEVVCTLFVNVVGCVMNALLNAAWHKRRRRDWNIRAIVVLVY